MFAVKSYLQIVPKMGVIEQPVLSERKASLQGILTGVLLVPYKGRWQYLK